MPMQPRPRAETVSGLVVPRVRVCNVMTPAKTFECTPSQGRSGVVLELAFVDADLHVDRPQVTVDLGQLGLDPLAVCLEQSQPFGLVPVAGADQPGVPADVADRHPGRAQPGDQLDPGQVLLAVAPVPGSGALG